MRLIKAPDLRTECTVISEVEEPAAGSFIPAGIPPDSTKVPLNLLSEIPLSISGFKPVRII